MVSSEQNLPVIVGVGQILQRLDDPQQAAEPLEMMIAALKQAGQDSGVPELIRKADSIYVVRGIWSYFDPARVIAQRLEARPSETVGTPFGGSFSHSCVVDAARRIQSGEDNVFLVTGAENGRTMAQARRTWGLVDDPNLLEAMTHEEFCGRQGHLDGIGNLKLK